VTLREAKKLMNKSAVGRRAANRAATEFMNLVRSMLASSGLYVIRVATAPVPRNKTGGGFYMSPNPMAGTSDLLCITPGGRILAVEVKFGSGRLEPKQRAFLVTVDAMGGLAMVVRHLDQVRELLDQDVGPSGDRVACWRAKVSPWAWQRSHE
jgi:hypothetical protein